MREIQQEPDLAYAKWQDVENFASVRQFGGIQERKKTIEKSLPSSMEGMRDSLIDVNKGEMLE